MKDNVYIKMMAFKDGGVFWMYENQKNSGPVFRLDVNGTVVTVRFSETEMPDIKAKIRDILTESYEERFQRRIQERMEPV